MKNSIDGRKLSKLHASCFPTMGITDFGHIKVRWAAWSAGVARAHCAVSVHSNCAGPSAGCLIRHCWRHSGRVALLLPTLAVSKCAAPTPRPRPMRTALLCARTRALRTPLGSSKGSLLCAHIYS